MLPPDFGPRGERSSRISNFRWLLPALDPTALGWKERDFYLAPDFYSAIFDWSGNCGTTAWWIGQTVGAYVQDDAGRLELMLGRCPGRAGRAALRAEAQRLEQWLDGEKVNALYKSPLATRVPGSLT
jgi:Winged helix DNA-binding domain